MKHSSFDRLLVAGAIVTTLAVVALSHLRVEGDIFGLLGHDDPVVADFEKVAEVTPGLEDLLVVCEPNLLLSQAKTTELLGIEGIASPTQTYFRAGSSTVQGFALSVDPSDWRQTRAPIQAARQALHDTSCGLTGTPAVVHDMQSRLNADLKITLALAAVFVSFLFTMFYRIGWLAALMLLPVGAGIAWGLAAYSMFRGELTLLAATVPTLLIGIGIDHCIHLIQSCRYSMAMEGLPRHDAVLRAWQRLLQPITLASLTTAVTFLALTTASLRGLQDLGWSGALVMMGVYAACISMLPAMLLRVPERWMRSNAGFDRRIRALAPRLRAHGRALVICFVIVGATSVYGVTQLGAINDNRLLESGDLDSVALQERIALELGLSSSPWVLRFENPDDALELLAELERPEQVANILAVNGVDGLLQVHPRANTFLRHNYREMESALAAWINEVGLGSYALSGAPMMNERINALVYRDVRVVLPIAVLATLVVLAIGMRSLLRPCLVLLPLALAILWLLGSMGLAGIAASFVTVAITPLVLGIGVDGGVHLIAAWDRHAGNINEVFAETGLAVIITVMTSVAAFAAFIASRSPSLVYFGSQAAFALVGCLVVTLVVLPYLFGILLPQPKDTTIDDS